MSLSATGRELCGGTENTYKYSNVAERDQLSLIATLKECKEKKLAGTEERRDGGSNKECKDEREGDTRDV